MKNKINLVELLKDCPQGMELDCTLCDDIVFERIDFSSNYPIAIKKLKTTTTIYLTKYGQYINEEGYKCTIFPKGKTSWEGFVPPCKFNDGDVVVAENKANVPQQLFLLKCVKYREDNNGYDGYCYFGWDFSDNRLFGEGNWGFNRLATEEEKQKLFDTINANGYRWNQETKTLEKLIKPKFKVGDKIIKKNSIYAPMLITQVGDEFYYSNIDSSVGILPISKQDEYELIPNKFDINTLVPFESRVLVRDYSYGPWKVSLWGCLVDSSWGFIYDTIRGSYMQCIPYEGNEHLLGKTDDCVEYYKNWK